MSDPGGYKCTIPEGVSGSWQVSRFEVTKEECGVLQAMRDLNHCGQVRTPHPGTYTKLTCGGALVMSDTPAELRDLLPLKAHAKGRMLIHGLGLGIAVERCLMSAEVVGVTVIEKSHDVIKLVEPTLRARYGARLRVLLGDAYTLRPDGRMVYDAVWSDIWNDITAENVKGMVKLRKMWARRARWHGVWCEDLCLRMGARAPRG